MEKIIYETNVLGSKGQRGRIDKTLAQEFGWGRHTFESCYINFEGKTINDSDPLRGNYVIIRSNGCIYSSDVGILIILTSDPDDLISHTMKSFKKEEKYIIRYEEIADIIIERGLQYDDSIQAFSNQYKERARQRTVLHFKDDGCCFIDTFEGTQFTNHIINVWEASIIRNTTFAGSKLIANGDHNLAKMYYDETIKSLNSSKNLDETIEILEEFSNEIQLDLELKEVAFQSRELFVKCYNLYNYLLDAPSGLTDDRKTTKTKFVPPTPRSSGGTPRNSTPRASMRNEEFVNRLTVILIQRLKVMKVILHVLVNSLFCSEFTTKRLGFLGGPSPLTVDSWLGLFVPDSYELLAESLGCPIDEKVDLKKELEKSFNIDEPLTSQKSKRDPNKRGYSIVDEIMTPVRRKQIQSFTQNTSGSVGIIAELNRGINDMKYIMLLEMARICQIGNHHDKSIKTYSTHVCFGDVFSRAEGWTDCLEKLIYRISSVLDDILATHGLFSPRGDTERMSLHEISYKRLNLSLDNSSAKISLPQTPPKPSRKSLDRGLNTAQIVDKDRSKNNNLLKANVNSVAFSLNDTSYHIFETQEIILYYTTALVKLMSMDSSRIRGEINEQAQASLSAIMNVLNSICPRKEESAKESNEAPESVDVTKPTGKCESFFSKFLKKTEVVEEAYKTITIKNFLVSDYGPCPLNMDISGNSWILLVLSRRSIEYLLDSLNLHIPLKSDIKLYVDDIKDQSSQGRGFRSIRNLYDENKNDNSIKEDDKELETLSVVKSSDKEMVDLSNTPVSTPPLLLIERPRSRRSNLNLKVEVPSPTSPDRFDDSPDLIPKRAYSPITYRRNKE